MTSISLAKTQNPDKIRCFDEKFLKDKQKVDRFKIFSNFVQSSYGSKKFFKAFYLSCKWPINFESFLKLNPARIKKIVDLKRLFKKVSQSLDITKVFTTIKNVKKISLNIQRKEFKNFSKKVFKIAIKVVQTILDLCTFIGLGQLFCLYSLGKANEVLKFSKRFFKIITGFFLLLRDRMKYIKLSKTQKVFENQKSEDQRLIIIFREIKNLDLLKLIKNISFITLNCFLVFEMIFQIVLFSLTLKIALSTITLSLTIFTHFYKESMTYPKISNKQ